MTSVAIFGQSFSKDWSRGQNVPFEGEIEWIRGAVVLVPCTADDFKTLLQTRTHIRYLLNTAGASGEIFEMEFFGTSSAGEWGKWCKKCLLSMVFSSILFVFRCCYC